MADMKQESGTLSGLTANEAQEFHSLFVKGFIGFTIIALIAHILVWMWRPWLPGEDGYSAIHETPAATLYAANVSSTSTLRG